MNKKAFTLVELIVVITILAVLWTIAFVSFQNYVLNSRDSKRTTDIKNIEKTLELSKLQTGVYPNPGWATNITFSWATAWRQWEFDNDVTRIVRNFKEAPKDPLVDSFYAYSVTKNRWEYQLWAVLEDIDYGTSPQWKLAAAYVKGNYNGKTVKVSTGSTTYILWAPSILTSDLNETDLLDIITAKKLVYKGHKNLPASYTGTIYKVDGGFDFSPQSWTIVAYEWDLASVDNSTLVDKLQAIFTWSVIVDESDIEVIFSENKDLTADIILWRKINNIAGPSSNNSEILAGWRLLDPNCKINDIVIGWQTWAWCNSTLWIWFERGQTEADIWTTNYNGVVYTFDDGETIINDDWWKTWEPELLSNYEKIFTWKVRDEDWNTQVFIDIKTIKGKMYSHAQAISGLVCPAGRKVPSNNDWIAVENEIRWHTSCEDSIYNKDRYCDWVTNTATWVKPFVEALLVPMTGVFKTSYMELNTGGWLWSSSISAGAGLPIEVDILPAYQALNRTPTSEKRLGVRCLKN